MSILFQIARRLQWVANLLPKRWRLPLRYRVQRAIGGLEPEFLLLPQLVARDKIALDIGANMGVYSYALSRLASHVHAFEPQAACCEVIASWAVGRPVTVHNVGVGSTSGELVLHVPIIDGRGVGTRASFTSIEGPRTDITVPIITIDSLNLEQIGFIKIDVEGFEHDVLAGAANTLRRDRPPLLIELDRGRHTPQSFQRTLDLLAGFGYTASVLVGTRLEACTGDFWEIAEDHYNFIFLAKGLSISPA